MDATIVMNKASMLSDLCGTGECVSRVLLPLIRVGGGLGRPLGFAFAEPEARKSFLINGLPVQCYLPALIERSKESPAREGILYDTDPQTGFGPP